MSSIMLIIKYLFNLSETKIRIVPVLPVVLSSQPTVTVSINVIFCPLFINVFTVPDIKPPVVVPEIVNAV